MSNLPATKENAYYHLIEKKSDLQKQAIEMHLSGVFKAKDIAEVVGRTTYTVNTWLTRDKDIAEYIQLVQNDEMKVIRQKLNTAAMNALDKMIELMNSDNEAFAIQAARDLLDRSGLKPVQQVKKDVTVTSYEDKMKMLIEAVDTDYELVEDDE